MALRLDKRNRYAHGTRIVRAPDGTAMFGRRRLLAAPKRPDDIIHTVADGDRLDLIAYRYYGDPHLAWVILDYAVKDGTRLMLPLRDLQRGMVLRMPSLSYLVDTVLTRRG